ncbi:helix-turn-helix domain-containing protein [Streptomyces purpurogeneiscleroticus]|uniref:helix-turn-helix domain-containing protein n=1 Tax=Streptomyces purpurogeneiscleroticus TaxID=68259 RepID=UPI001CBBCD4E|nr:helix-turn-helix domain-containing protein [Streptomyces purpurogeneiscleroticus]MBZ4019780.1 transcriptional regulator [Streptomyces purpurogeneiscleroticus]
MTEPADHPFVQAVKPLVDAMGGEMVAPDLAQGDDVVLTWEGEDRVAVRLPHLSDSLDHLLTDLERRHGRPLAELDRKTKQSVVRILEARGAFSVRHGVETVASALGVSRFTVYNYLNRENGAKAGR